MDDKRETERARPRICLSDLQADASAERGIKCRDCGGTWFRVISTRRLKDKIVRRRQCRHCERIILTTERFTA